MAPGPVIPIRIRSRWAISSSQSRYARKPHAERYRSASFSKECWQENLGGNPRGPVKTVIRYRNGVLNGKGASLLDGYMEDLATDRIYRLMIAQRMQHSDRIAVVDEAGNPIAHTPEL